MPQYEGELEKKIKRAYTEDSVASGVARLEKKRMSVCGVQTLLCAVAFAALAAVRLAAPDAFVKLREAYNALWESLATLTLEAASEAVRDAAEDFFLRLDDASH